MTSTRQLMQWAVKLRASERNPATSLGGAGGRRGPRFFVRFLRPPLFGYPRGCPAGMTVFLAFPPENQLIFYFPHRSLGASLGLAGMVGLFLF